jgi:hypothetical protein
MDTNGKSQVLEIHGYDGIPVFQLMVFVVCPNPLHWLPQKLFTKLFMQEHHSIWSSSYGRTLKFAAMFTAL